MSAHRPEHLPARMAAKITEDEHGCWIWKGALNSRGYGCVSNGAGKVVLTHRRSYELLVGPIVDTLQVDHLCKVKACCNPAHLEAVDQQTNMRRSREHITHCPKGHAYTSENTIWNHGTRRNCRTCQNERKRVRARERYQEQKLAAVTS